MNAEQKAFAVPAGGSRSRQTQTHVGQATVKVSGGDTEGAFVVFEVSVVPCGGPPTHIHRVENEWFYVLEGDMKFQVASDLFRVSSGGCVFAPRMVPHVFQNVGQTPARILALAVPAGRMEAFIVELDALFAARAPEPASIKAVFEKYGLELVGPPLSGWP